MSLLKNLLFKPEDEGAEPTPQPATPSATATPSVLAGLRRGTATTYNTRQPAAAASAVAVAAPSTPNAEFLAEIDQALAGGTKRGFAELQKQLDVLAIIPDETTRITTAMASVQAMLGLPATEIIAAVQEKIDLLNTHKQTTEAGIERELANDTTLNQNHIQDVQARITKNATEQQRLQEEARALAQDLADTQRQLDEMQINAASVRAEYNSAFKPTMDALTALLARIR